MNSQEGTATQSGHTPVTVRCDAARDVFALIREKWPVQVLRMLGPGALRFNELKRLIGCISQRMLTLTLRRLERDGMVARTVFPTVPPSVEYELTELGRSLLQSLLVLGEWGTQNHARVLQARVQFKR